MFVFGRKYFQLSELWSAAWIWCVYICILLFFFSILALTCEKNSSPCCNWIICHFLFPCIPLPPTVLILGPNKPPQWDTVRFVMQAVHRSMTFPTSCWRRMEQKTISYQWKVPSSASLTSLDLSDNNLILDKCCLNAINSAFFQVVQTGNWPSVSWISELAFNSFFPSLGMLQQW